MYPTELVDKKITHNLCTTCILLKPCGFCPERVWNYYARRSFPNL